MKSNKNTGTSEVNVSHILGDLDDIGSVIEQTVPDPENKVTREVQENTESNELESGDGWSLFMTELKNLSGGRLKDRPGALAKIDKDIHEALDACNLGYPKYIVINGILRRFIQTYKEELSSFKKSGISLLD